MANTYTIRTIYAGTSTQTVSGTPNIYLTGPSSTGSPGTKGLYVCESRSGASGSQAITYRWQEDLEVGGTGAAPTTYSALGL